MTTQAAITAPRRRLEERTTGGRLELQRLQHRERQVERVLVLLQRRVAFRASTAGEVPRPLNRAIEGFTGELSTIRSQLPRHSDA